MNGDLKPDIRRQTLPELTGFFTRLGEKPYRAGQVFEWLWKKGACEFSEMTSLPSGIREKLSEFFSFPSARLSLQQESRDSTVKTVFLLHDGLRVEGVLIPSKGRTTACISSQVGCALGCRFCATGTLGFTRNLTRGEIFDQVVGLNRFSVERHGVPLSNIVYMGMGEPLMNYAEVAASVERLTAPDALGISPQRITVSSVGIPKMIRQLADDGVKTHFALSLHAAINAKRDRIIPVNSRFPIEELAAALKYYHQVTRKRFTIEYVLLNEFNDTEADVKALAAFCKNFPVKINLIEYNSVEGSAFSSSGESRTRAFAASLERRNLVVNIRKSRGKDIAAACGQLVGGITQTTSPMHPFPARGGNGGEVNKPVL
jgi:23S rRNA (adenine2503-C2)-methyltransferase